MDRSNNGLYDLPERTSVARLDEGRSSVEAHSPQARLQKKRSNAGVRTTSQSQGSTSMTAGPRSPAPTTEGNRGIRKGSIRNAVRRMFGRRSREAEQPTQASQFSPPRHAYHRSEPTALGAQPSIPEQPAEEDTMAQRVLSAPMEFMSPPPFNRTRSPYAVEFPRSARLKPIALGDPFYAPGSQLRRRKTLPSVLIAGSEAEPASAPIESSDAPPLPSLQTIRDAPTPDNGTLASTSRSEKRKSRSAGDLRREASGKGGLPRKRSDEVRYWRESFQGSVLRASGFRVPSATVEPSEEIEEERTPMAQTTDPFDSGARSYGISPDVGSSSAFGTELSRDLEDRVAKLEAGLRNFRGELAQLTADRNRRTVLIGGVPRRRRASSGNRTASVLVDTLQSDLPPSSYQYDYTDTLRPSTSPQPPRTPVHADPFTNVPAVPVPEPTADDMFNTPPPIRAIPESAVNPALTANPTQPPQHTFRSLYEMLADERSARRKLEMQLRGLQNDIANLNYQVSLQSNVQSQRSSYYAPMDPRAGSSRLQALLHETETSPPGTSSSQHQSGARDSAEQQHVVSRFSGSESEIGGMGESEDLQTPYDAYQTPREEQARFPFDERPPSTASDMF